jgi:hypothetical protein
METIEDIRAQYGNPRHGQVGGPPRAINKFFGGPSGMKALAALLFILAAILIAAGVFSIIFPIAIAGFAFLGLAAIVWFRAKAHHHHLHHHHSGGLAVH